MKVPLEWLSEYVDLSGLSPQEIADRLTFSGLEVEAVEAVGLRAEGVVVAEVLEVRPHPKADRLQLAVVKAEEGSAPMTVVCGAPNVRPGLKAPLARVGARLADGTLLRPATIRGVTSEGMLCAEDELGLSDDHTGLMELPPDARPGEPLERLLGPADTVLTVEVTPNRPDCLSLVGVARELSLLLERPLRIPEPALPPSSGSATERLGVVLEDPVGCPRYTARLLTGARIAPSPAWLRRRLERAGVRAINNVVDITNYVMLECGQPLHAFDLRRLQGGRIVVRRAREGETLQTLDGIVRRLTPAMLVIADSERPVALAGIMGGEESGIGPDTSEIVLESAHFQPALIRKTSKTLGLTSESSYRFERGSDPEGAEWASRRAAALLVELAGASVTPEFWDLYPSPQPRRRITLRFERARDLLGTDPGADRMIHYFEGLGLRVLARDVHQVEVEAPSWRVDLEREADLIEEAARLYGLDRIPAADPAARLAPGADDRPIRARLEVGRALSALGLMEIMNYSFTSEKLLERVDPTDRDRWARLPNPLSADHAVLRPSLLPQMVETLGRNRSRQCDEAALFEVGRVFFRTADGGWGESERVAIGLMERSGVGALDEESSFRRLKGILESLSCALRMPPLEKGGLRLPAVELEAAEWPWAEPGLGVTVRMGRQAAGRAGVLRTDLRREWRMADPVAVAELEMEALTPHLFRVPAYRPAPVHPSVDRDMAFLVDESVRHADVLRVILEGAPPELRRVRLFDIYRDPALVKAGRKSMAYRLTYQSATKTLTDEEANAYHDRIKAGITRALRAEMRE